MGSAAAFELARRGRRVLALEQFALGHDQGSSHGHTCIIHKAYSQVVLAAGFSGHGFKFASVVGEIFADLAEKEKTEPPIELFRLTRFTIAPIKPGKAQWTGPSFS